MAKQKSKRALLPYTETAGTAKDTVTAPPPPKPRTTAQLPYVELPEPGARVAPDEA